VVDRATVLERVAPTLLPKSAADKSDRPRRVAS
jgi:hypothetical protein